MKKACRGGVLIAILLYGCAYAALTMAGRYEPGTVGLNGVKSYAWAPLGFASPEGRWNRGLMLVFSPCYFLDCHVWHTSDWRTVEKYPVHRMSREDVYRTYY